MPWEYKYFEGWVMDRITAGTSFAPSNKSAQMASVYATVLELEKLRAMNPILEGSQ